MRISWKTMSAIAVLGAAVATTAIAAGCNSVLGIDEAKIDPRLSDASSEAGGGDDCDKYCTTIDKNCTGQNKEYINVATCKAMCVHLEPGIAGDQTGDSLACRTYHAGAAAGDPNFHCRHAGPVGGGHCGDRPCNPYCLLDFALCGGQPSPPFDGGELGCKQQCEGVFQYDTGPDAGDISATSGNTLNCRIYHLEAAYDPSNPSAVTTHCPHTGPVSATCN